MPDLAAFLSPHLARGKATLLRAVAADLCATADAAYHLSAELHDTRVTVAALGDDNERLEEENSRLRVEMAKLMATRPPQGGPVPRSEAEEGETPARAVGAPEGPPEPADEHWTVYQVTPFGILRASFTPYTANAVEPPLVLREPPADLPKLPIPAAWQTHGYQVDAPEGHEGDADYGKPVEPAPGWDKDAFQ